MELELESPPADMELELESPPADMELELESADDKPKVAGMEPELEPAGNMLGLEIAGYKPGPDYKLVFFVIADKKL